MSRVALLLLALLIAAPAFAQEPVGCDKFKWPLDKERAMLAAAIPVAAGGEIADPFAAAFRLPLAPTDAAGLPMPPTRAPRAGSNAGYVKAASPGKAGTYRITLSEGSWIDVFQDGHEMKSAAFSGATGCEGVRKSVKFELRAMPFIIELSGTTANMVAVAITPD